MESSTTSDIYIHVIEDVVNKIRDEFINNGGPGESVLNELQGLWELKMMQAGAIFGPKDRTASQKAGAGGPITPNPLHDLNVPYEGTEEYETPTADLLFPPTPLQTPMQTPFTGTTQTPLPGFTQTPLPGIASTPLSDNSSFFNISTGGTPYTPNEYASTNENAGVSQMKTGHGRPSPYMQPPSAWTDQRPPLDVNVAFVEGRQQSEKRGSQHPTTQDFFMPSGKRKRDDFVPHYNSSGYIPQHDGAGDNLSDEFEVVQGEAFPSRITQLDGPIPDPFDDALSTPNMYTYQGVVNEDYNVVNTPMPNEMQAATPAPVPNDTGDDDDEPLNEDDDDDLDDVDEEEGLNTTHLILAQFDKVTRTKSRWKCTLKDGIMHINNKDVLFNKATGEFDF